MDLNKDIQNMRFVIVTGMSGAGKSTALNMLEDAGFFCVDNLPVPLIGRFSQFVSDSISDDFSKVALGIDVRNRRAFDQLGKALNDLQTSNVKYEILFLDADDHTLVKRYKETRRKHPLAGSGRIMDGILAERKMMEYLRLHADYVLDTSRLLTRELQESITELFVKNEGYKALMVNVVSFGFKYGIPQDADLVFDVRFLPNPYYLEELRPLTGNDEAINDFVMKHRQSTDFLDKLEDLLRFLIPNYIAEGKHQLVVGIGCTGGKHRSVTLANQMSARLDNSASFDVRIEHRDIDKDRKRGK